MGNRILGNWQTSLAGVGMILLTAAQWSQGDGSLSLADVVQLLTGAGFLASKDAQTGSAPGGQ